MAQAKNTPVSDVRVVQEYANYLRVEKGLRPLSCEAYQRDLEQLAEFLERTNGTLMTATQAGISSFMEELRRNRNESCQIEAGPGRLGSAGGRAQAD